MSFFVESNQDATSLDPEQVTPGPLVGFLEAFDVSLQAQRRAASQQGIANYMEELDARQSRVLADLGERDPAAPPEVGADMLSLGIPELYEDVARREGGEQANAAYAKRIDAYDERIRQLQSERPDLELMTSSQMFGQVQQQAQYYDQRERSDNRTWGGAFGGFVGGALASLAPDTDPLNFYTLGVGGAGKSAVTRILSQTGGQGAVETLNQVTGVQEQRRLLGLSHGLSDAAARVAGTALGAGSLQAAGELVAVGAKRWFRNAPNDPAPPLPEPPAQPTAPQRGADLREEAQVALLERNPEQSLDVILGDTPLSGIRSGSSRARVDVRDMATQLDRWDAPHPNAIRPQTDTSPFRAPDTTARVDLEAPLANNRVYQLAREFDPRAFDQYDKLLERRNTYRRWIDELATERDAELGRAVDAIETRIGQLERQRRTTPGKGPKSRIREQIREAEADRDTLLRESSNRENSGVAAVREDLARNDEKMRDIAPLMGRAYAHARGRWTESEPEFDAIWQGYINGRAEPEEVPYILLPDQRADQPVAITERIPLLREAAKVEEGRTVAETASNVAVLNRTQLETALDDYRQELSTILDAEDDILRVDGSDFEFNLDRDTITLPREDGDGGRQVTIRQMLEEHRRVEEELEAVSQCSLPSRSSPA